MNLSRLGQAAWTLLADALWPPGCTVCGRDENLGEAQVCLPCWRSLMPAGSVEKPSWIHEVHAAFAYDDLLRHLVHRYKFERDRSLGEPLGHRFAARMARIGLLPAEGAVAPVPDHPSRRRERGFNPAWDLARVLAERARLPFRPGLVTRIKAGPHQSSLPDQERSRALEGAFHVDPPPPDLAPTLILVDDVIHTGTTLSRLGKAARRAGWKRVTALVLSR